MRQRDSDVDSNRRLADAALARADGDDVLHAGHRLSGSVGQRRRAYRGGHLDLHVGDAGQARHRRAGLIPHLVLHRARRRRQLNLERHAAAVDGELLHEAERDDVLVQVGVAHGAKRLENGGWIGTAGHWIRFARTSLYGRLELARSTSLPGARRHCNVACRTWPSPVETRSMGNEPAAGFLLTHGGDGHTTCRAGEAGNPAIVPVDSRPATFRNR